MMKTFVVTVLGLMISTLGSCSTDCGLNMLSKCNTLQAHFLHTNIGNKTLVDALCSADRILFNCLTSFTCYSKIATVGRFLALQYAISSKKTFCPDLKYGALQKLVDTKALKSFSEPAFNNVDLEKIEIDKPCAGTCLKQCSGEFHKKMMNHENFCHQLEGYVDCIEEGSRSCGSTFLSAYARIDRRILEKFVHFVEIQEHGKFCKDWVDQ